MRLKEREWCAAGTAGAPRPSGREEAKGGTLHNTLVSSWLSSASLPFCRRFLWLSENDRMRCATVGNGLHDEAVRPLHVDSVALTLRWRVRGVGAHEEAAGGEQVGAQAASQDF